ncbi:hypothetical protein WDZ92_46305, partial [Nostoc sp. NIES-2111]
MDIERVGERADPDVIPTTSSEFLRLLQPSSRGPIARLVARDGERVFSPQRSETVALLSGQVDAPRWNVSSVQGRTAAIRIVTSDGTLWLEASNSPETADSPVRLSAMEQPDLWLEIRPGSVIRIEPPHGSASWTIEARQGEVIRIKLASLSGALHRASVDEPASLPSEFHADASEGSIALVDAAGRPVAWAFRAEEADALAPLSMFADPLTVMQARTR